MYAQCTKHNQRRAARPVDRRDRSAENPKITKRTDVERGTEGKIFWGDRRPEEGKQTHPNVWVTSHHVDYPSGSSSSVSKRRSDFMRSERGDEKTPRYTEHNQKPVPSGGFFTITLNFSKLTFSRGEGVGW
ncbi:hypothetical protein DIPPA_02554 [Diplonema papillatum]|nr:hypothetical protein DIPPA_02554 [Diplonema papillatum]